jgi:ketosteroid isomerase-like protein
MKRLLAAVLLFGTCFLIPIMAQENTPQNDILTVKNMINEWVDLFNRRDLKKLKTLYAEDFLASYPNQPDQNFEITIKSFEHLFQNNFLEMKMSIKVFEIETKEDLAYVRLNQISEVKPKNVKKPEYGEDTGIQIWKKDSDGNWQLSRSVMIPIQIQAKKK